VEQCTLIKVKMVEMMMVMMKIDVKLVGCFMLFRVDVAE